MPQSQSVSQSRLKRKCESNKNKYNKHPQVPAAWLRIPSHPKFLHTFNRFYVAHHLSLSELRGRLLLPASFVHSFGRTECGREPHPFGLPLATDKHTDDAPNGGYFVDLSFTNTLALSRPLCVLCVCVWVRCCRRYNSWFS